MLTVLVWAKPEATWEWRRLAKVVSMAKAPKQRLGVLSVQSSLSCGGLYTMTEVSRPLEPPKTGESHQTQMQKLGEVRVWERQENSPSLTPFNLKQSYRGLGNGAELLLNVQEAGPSGKLSLFCFKRRTRGLILFQARYW